MVCLHDVHSCTAGEVDAQSFGSESSSRPTTLCWQHGDHWEPDDHSRCDFQLRCRDVLVRGSHSGRAPANELGNTERAQDDELESAQSSPVVHHISLLRTLVPEARYVRSDGNHDRTQEGLPLCSRILRGVSGATTEVKRLAR
jgi:hypothetical protein